MKLILNFYSTTIIRRFFLAIEVNLEKYGHKKKGFLGFSWTAFFFNFFVPLFRLDFVGFFIFISPYLIAAVLASFIFIKEFDNENVIVSASLFSAILRALSRLILPFFYNKMYTQKLLKQGYLPPVDDEYSNALLKGNRFLEYTNEELLDKEKIERYAYYHYSSSSYRSSNCIFLFYDFLFINISVDNCSK